MTKPEPQKKRPRAWKRPAFLSFLLALALLGRPAERYTHAASLLLRFANPNAQGFLPTYRKHALDETLLEVPTSAGPVRARLYSPQGITNAPGIILVHGVHRLSIDEPRLIKFARAMASAGTSVLTPEVKEIAEYRIDPASIKTIGASATALRQRLGGKRVGIMGMSFAGGLGLRAAADPAFADDVAFVVAIGAHHDMGRVLQFFQTNHIQWPDGHDEALVAHPYGGLVLLYSHIELLVPAKDAPIAREAIKLWLWEQKDEAKTRLLDLGPESRAKITDLLDGKADVPALIEEIMREGRSADAISPKGHLAGLQAPVFLLHGAGDTVIPAAETAWLATEVPPSLLREALVTPALVHVELAGEPSATQQYEMVRFMAGVLGAAEGR